MRLEGVYQKLYEDRECQEEPTRSIFLHVVSEAVSKCVEQLMSI